MVRTRISEISVVGRSAQGVRVIRLDTNEKVVGVDKIAGLAGDDVEEFESSDEIITTETDDVIED